VSGDFDPTERRIVGVLIEKALATPDYYPMTLNALVTACNQKNNRDPVTSYAEFEVDGALRSLVDKKWVTYVEGGGRVRKWKHRVDERLGVSTPELAVLAELLLRGAQQPGELRSRSGRMANIPTQEALMELLDQLSKRLPPLVVKLPRQPGERAERFGQTLAPDGTDAAPASPPRAAEPGIPAPAPAAGSLPERIERLERQLAALRSELDALARRLDQPGA
jgi:uncharacterized protein YceH (UPF0502 family)